MDLKEKQPNGYYSIEIEDFFKSAFSIDPVIFGFENDELKVLLVERGADPYMGYFALPGDLVYPDEDLDLAASRILYELTQLSDVYMEQVYTFGSVDRHPYGRVITVAYYSLINIRSFNVDASSWAKQANWYPVENLPKLAFDHEVILNRALKRLQERVRTRPIGFELLPSKFTLRQLQSLYEALLKTELDTRNFRKKVLSMGLLRNLEERQQGVAHRPAKLYSFDNEAYEELTKRGLNFDL